ncbi:MAG: hypothetical protein HC915_06030 [Anaerolineae bacterium]|nr:hypothetical protein [Anaerolineae bacterium]
MNPAALNAASGTLPVTCPACGMNFAARPESVIDAGRDPQAKARFLSGQTNLLSCPNCSTVIQMETPIIYHDHTKELLITYVPPQLNLPPQERERIVGEMTRAIMQSLPQEERKGYLFNPVQPLTKEGMMEFILEKDGITREMLQDQRQKARLVEQFLLADPADLPEMARTHDAEMDDAFFQLMTAMVESVLAAGSTEEAQNLLNRRDHLLGLTSYGKQALARARQQEIAIAEVSDWLEQRGGRVSLNEFLGFIERIGGNDDRLQALVGLTRPMLSPQFFATFEQYIQQSSPERRGHLQAVRARMEQLISQLDQQQQAMVQQAQYLINLLLNAEDPEQTLEESLPLVDELFLQVLGATIEQAEGRNELITAARLKQLEGKLMQRLRADAPPEVQFINALLETDNAIEAKLLLSEQAASYGQPLLDYMDMLIANFSQHGPDADHIVDRLREYRSAAQRIIEEAHAH